MPRARAICALLAALCCATSLASAAVNNLTGLPAYPNLDSGAMDPLLRVETLGRWCARFSASTGDSLLAVEDWYRKTLWRASETDLLRDDRFQIYPTLSGIKLAVGLDYVAVYQMPRQRTVIELHRCHWDTR